MRALTVVVVILAAVWGGYWFVGASALKNGSEAWFQAQTDAGMVATRDSLNVAGFPNRFDLTVKGLHLDDPATGVGWSAPVLRLFSLSYTPWHWIAVLPSSQTVDLPGQTLTVTATDLRSSLVLVPGTALALDRVALTGADLAVSSTLGWRFGTKSLALHTRQAVAAHAHEIDLAISDVTADPALTSVLADSGLPVTMEAVHLNAVLAFSAPLDRFAGETRPMLTKLSVKEARITWGSNTVLAQGDIAPDANGQAEGRIDLRIEDWRKLLAVAQAMGLITPEVAPTWETALAMLAEQSGDPDVLHMPLTMQNGRMSLGFLPLGAAPLLR